MQNAWRIGDTDLRWSETMVRAKFPSSWLVSIVLTQLGMQTAVSQQSEGTLALEEALVEQAVEELYIRGLRIRDFDLIRTVCLPEAVLMSVRSDGSLSVTTLDRWSQRFDPANPPFRQLQSSIVTIDREGTAAQVKILFVIDGERRVTDFLHLLKVDGRWRITGIIDY